MRFTIILALLPALLHAVSPLMTTPDHLAAALKAASTQTLVRRATRPSFLACQKKLLASYPAYENLNHAISLYSRAVRLIPDELTSTTAEHTQKKNDITLVLQAALTYVKMAQMDTMDDKLRWRKALMMGKIAWLQAKAKVALKLSGSLQPMPRLQWVSKLVGGAQKGLAWLWGKLNPKKRKARGKMNTRERKASSKVNTFVSGAGHEADAQGKDLTSKLCAKLRH